ncbi:hypothetical protein C0989_002590, partial [Termitomyces sp. Mn162]
QIILGSGKALGVQGNSGDASTAAEKALELIKELSGSAEEVLELPEVGAEGGRGLGSLVEHWGGWGRCWGLGSRVVGGGGRSLGAYIRGGSSAVGRGNGPRFSFQVWYGPQGGPPCPYRVESCAGGCNTGVLCRGRGASKRSPDVGVVSGSGPKQGWDHEWVAAQLEEGWRGRVSGRGSGVEGGVGAGRPPMKIGPPQGGWREEAPLIRDKGKQRTFPLPEAGPSKWAWGELVMAGPLGPTVYSLTSGALVEQSVGGSWSVAKAFLRRQAEELERLLATRGEEVHRVGEERDGLRRELDEAWKERDLACRDKDIAVGTATERLSQLQEL